MGRGIASVQGQSCGHTSGSERPTAGIQVQMVSCESKHGMATAMTTWGQIHSPTSVI
nr:MAG TPA: hypothetical protein [Caudoviricetes sp.]